MTTINPQWLHNYDCRLWTFIATGYSCSFTCPWISYMVTDSSLMTACHWRPIHQSLAFHNHRRS